MNKKIFRILKNIEYLFMTSNFFFFKFLRKILIFNSFSSYFVNTKDLAFFYDLNINPVTFDFAHYLVQAEEFRRKKKLANIDVFIIKPKYKIPARMASFSVNNSQFEIENRTYEIIFPLTRLLTTVKNKLIISKNFLKKNDLTKKYKNIFPEGYSYTSPIPCKHGMSKTKSSHFYPMFSPSPRSMEIIKKYLKGIKKKIITITIRDSYYIKSRNSNFSEWIKFAKYLKKKYEVIFIPDAINYSLLDKKKFKDFIIADYVVWNLSLRTALYEQAFINCSIISAPAEICSMYNFNSKSLIFLNKKSYPKKYLKMCIEEWGESEIQPWMSKYHKYVYKADTFKNLKNEFDIHVKKIMN
jgi:hypothetical protein